MIENFTIKALRYNPGKRRLGPLKVAVHKALQKTLRDAVRYSLEQLVLAHIIPSWSGMTWGQFLPLARAVRAVTIIRSQIRQTAPDTPRGYSQLGGGWDYNIYPSEFEGEKLGRNAYKLLYGTPNRPVFQFHYKMVVFQYWLHEIMPHAAKASSSGPWGSFEIMISAFERYMMENWTKNLPDIPEWVLTGEIKQ
jgi:hypothetical protein